MDILKDFSPRLYQETIFNSCTEKNTLVVLPTGLGKTAIALMLTAHRLKLFPDSRVLFLAPTKPLVEQHFKTFKKHLNIDENLLSILTGSIQPEKRKEIWERTKIIFSTPQGLENDILSERISLKDVSLVIFDEAHRAIGNYSYCLIADRYHKVALCERILALTASPGSELEKIEEVCNNLFLENIEIRTYDDVDVKPYIKPIETRFIEFELTPELMEIKKYLENCILSKLKKLKEVGFIKNERITKKELLELQGILQSKIARGEQDRGVWSSISIVAEALKVEHAIELLETQSPESLFSYVQKLKEEEKHSKSKAVKNLLKDDNFRYAIELLKNVIDKGIEHPKFIELLRIVKEKVEKENSIKMIIFNNFRENALKIVNALTNIGIRAHLFIGQTNKNNSKGLSQREQREIIERFKRNEFNVLVATSIGEEGLDIPKVDSVIFYEPIPSVIRHIQRRGRTGRNERGELIVLITKGTRDSIYRWAVLHKEKKMLRTLKSLKKRLSFKNERETKIKDFLEGVKIIADYREKGNRIIKEFLDLGIKIDLSQLACADYLLSSRVGVELKSVKDFVDSILDGRLLEQVKLMRNNFERPLIVIEGEEDIFSQRNIHPNAIRGAIATITIDYGIPIIQTNNSQETAALMSIIAKREQENKDREARLHQKKPLTMSEIQEYIVSSFPMVGPNLAKKLLEKFKTIKGIVNAEEDELKNVEGIGEKISKRLKDVFENEYK